MNENIIVGNKKYILSGFYGRVVDQQISSESYSNRGYDSAGWYDHSRTYSTKELFLVNPNGEERAFSFTNKLIPGIRPGHIVQVMWLQQAKKESGRYVFIRNVTLNEEYLDEEKVKEIFLDRKTQIIFLIFGLMIAIVAGAFLLLCLFILVGAISGSYSIITPIFFAVTSLFIVIFGTLNFRKKTQKKYDKLFSEILNRKI